MYKSEWKGEDEMMGKYSFDAEDQGISCKQSGYDSFRGNT